LFTSWGRIVVRLRWVVLGAALALFAVGAGWGTQVFSVLASAGFNPPGTESARASQLIQARLGYQNESPDLVVLYSSKTATVNQPGLRSPVSATVRAIRQHRGVADVVSYYGTGSPALVSRDRHATYAAIWLTAPGASGKRQAYEALLPALKAPGVTTRVGGTVALDATVDAISKSNVTRGERLALPVVLILLVFIFGGLAAASMPLLIGTLAILGAFTATRIIASFTPVSTFAVNSITLLGLGMAVDYSLFMVSRFREELRAGRDTRDAVAATMATAGRTVLVSGLTVALALASLLVFPENFLRSMGIGGMAAVLVAMLSALTVLPATLTVLGPRINALRVPMPAWLRRGPRDGPAAGWGWARLARSVMRRPVLYLAAVIVVVGVLAAPLAGIRFGGFDERILPPGTEARVTTEQIAADFPGGAGSLIQAVVTGASAAGAQQLADRIGALPGVTGARVSASRDTTTLVSVRYAGPPAGSGAYQAVRDIRALPLPAGVRMLVGGSPAQDVDLLASLGARLPWMAAIMAAVTFLLLFLAFGSVVLAADAVLMNLASVGASFGVMTWIFQHGHLSGLLGFSATGVLEPTIPVLILAVLFGLATDYEVFLLSRVREAWDKTGDNTTAVAAGLQRTGGIITAAALLLIVVVAGFSTGTIVFTKMIGVGLTAGLLLDATIVRLLLVPAIMRLLGKRNWWAPAPLAALYRTYGIREPAGSSPRPGNTRVPALLPPDRAHGGEF
jgi:trehalose monomycolate/heme transporter